MSVFSNNELISIIVPVYNMEKYLERCVNSILAQTYDKIEIILVDDGSTDDSAQMCDEYAQKDTRIKVVHKKNGGLSDARNAGLDVASGGFIGYVDSDDWIEPDMYERMHTACVSNNAQIAVCRYMCENEGADTDKGQEKNESDESDEIVKLSRDELLRIYICGHDKYVIYNSVWSKLFRRDIVEGVLFPKGRNSEDIMYTTRAFCGIDKAVYIDRSLYHYVLNRKDSIMNVAKGERLFRDEIPFWREHIAYIHDKVSAEMADLASYYFWRRLLFYYIDMKRAGKENIKYAGMLVDEISSDKEEIARVYASGIVSKGDRARMKLFMFSSSLYAFTVNMYDGIVLPLRRCIMRN